MQFLPIILLQLVLQANALPVSKNTELVPEGLVKDVEAAVAKLGVRQDISIPGLLNATDLDLSDIDIIPEAFLEGDSDSGGENDGAGDANSVANGYPGLSVGSGSSSFNQNGSTSGSSACCKWSTLFD
jgi:hypothetical protein